MSTARRRALGAVSAVAALALAGGIAAQFTTSTTSAPQQIGTGTLALSLDNVAPTVWTDDIANLAAGDTVQRFVDVRNSGSLKMSSLSLSQTNTLGDLLTSPSDVQVKFDACSVAWNATTGTCSTGAIKVLDSTGVRSWTGALPLSTFEDFGAGEIRHLRLSTTLATTATNAVQNKSGTITYTFGGTQRAAGTTGNGSVLSDSATILGSPATIGTAPSTTSPGSTTFSFSDPTNGKASYLLSWGETGNSQAAPQQAEVPKGRTSYDLTGLKPGVGYDVTLSAQLGVQRTSSTTSFTAPVPAPSGLVVSSLTDSGAKLSWADTSGGKAGFEVSYTAANGSSVVKAVPAGTSSLTLTGLAASTNYSVTVKASINGVFSDSLVGSFKTNVFVPVNTNFAATSTVGQTGSLRSFTVPATGKYTITAVGAAGGSQTYTTASGGNGAYIRATVNLTAGDVLNVLVGQKGYDGYQLNSDVYGAGGGGGSFVVLNPSTSKTLLVAAGGGGGAGRTSVGYGASSSNCGTGNGATVCTGDGGTNSSYSDSVGGSGGGWLSSGAVGNNGATGGGAYPGTGGSSRVVAYGGYGGGGGASSNSGGGGGGYSGGSARSYSAGGGGGSYTIPGATVVSAISGQNSGTGSVTITYVG